jgi:hypothetical protein
VKQSTWIAMLVAVAVVVGAGAFYGGMKYGENRIMQDPGALIQRMRDSMGGEFPGVGTGRQFPGGGQTGTRGQATGGLVAGGAMGTIQEIEGNTITLSTDSENVQVITSDTTFIQKLMDVGTEDLEVGERVIVTGSENDDGTITARSIRSAQGMRATDTSGQ